jgi:type IV secretory pathway VirB10-like protein
MTLLKSSAADPRITLSDDALAQANLRTMPDLPAGSGFSPSFWLGMAGVGLLGVLTFNSLASQRAKLAIKPIPTAMPVPAPLPAPIATVPVPAPAPISVPPPASPPVSVPPPAPPPLRNGPTEAERLKAPAMVVDLSRGAATPSLLAADSKPGDKNADQLSADEKFAERLAQAENPPARAVRMKNSSDLVPQGAIVAAVLETAINSDLPGFVRAVVSRDVTGFDGRKILIPRGSRLIGQYRAANAAGQTRAFVVWSRLLRTDGVSVQLASPITDPLGRAGVGGTVDSHFFKRFGSAILLSVIGSGLDRLANNQGGIVVRTAEDAKSVAGIALERDINIPPTVKVAQGTPIRIFIARDLDFTGTGSVATP